MQDRIGRYRLLERIGAGSQGTVYRAEDPDLDRIVAIKVFDHLTTMSDQDIQPIRREARLAAALPHPNIATIYEFQINDDVAYMVMEYVPDSLDRHIKSETEIDLEETLEILIQACSALSSAHDAGIVHRDIKPPNILLTDSRSVKVVDFGVARLMESSTTATTVGTFAYMSPEQWKGERVDQRTDIYSLGVVAYEMLVGNRPFDGNLAELFQKHTGHAVPEIPEELRIPPALEMVVEKALSKDPNDRFHSASEMANALSSAIARGSPRESETSRQVSGDVNSPRRKLSIFRWASVIPGSLLAAVALTFPWHLAVMSLKLFMVNIDIVGLKLIEYLGYAILSPVAIIFCAVFIAPSRKGLVNKIAALTVACGILLILAISPDTYFANHFMYGEGIEKRYPIMILILHGAAIFFGFRLNVWRLERSQSSTEIATGLNSASTRSSLSDPESLEIRGKWHRFSGKKTIVIVTSVFVISILLLAIAFFSDTGSSDGTSHVSQSIPLSVQPPSLGEKTSENVETILTSSPSQKPDDKNLPISSEGKPLKITESDATPTTSIAISHYYTAVELSEKGRLEEALNELTKAIEIDPKYADAYDAKGRIYYSMKDWDQAIVEYSEALSIDPLVSDVYLRRGIAYFRLSKFELALADNNMAILLDPQNYAAYLERGYVHGVTGSHTEAIEDFTVVIEGELESWKLSNVYATRGGAYRHLGEYEKALNDANAAIKLNSESSSGYMERSTVLLSMGKPIDALEDIDIAIILDPENSWVYFEKGQTLMALMNVEEAIENFTKAIELDPSLQTYYRGRAMAYFASGEYEKVIEDITYSLDELKVEPEETANLYSSRGLAHYRLGQYEFALADLSVAIGINPINAYLYYTRGNTYRDLGQLLEAESDYSKAIQIDPTDPLFFYDRGQIRMSLNKFTEAESDFIEAERLGYK